MTKRIIVSLAAIGLLLPLAASAQKLQPTQQLTVFDANGKKVGPVAAAQEAYGVFVPLVSFKVDGTSFMLYVFRDGFLGSRAIVWESTDCTGTPFIQLGSTSLRSSMPRVAVGLPGSTVYVEDGPQRTVAVRSYSSLPWSEPPWPPSHCTPPAVIPWTMTAVPARALIDMDTLFKEPFTVR